MTRRYYVPELLKLAPHVELPEEEALHAARVMRVNLGDEIELFDGRGNQAAAKVVSVGRRDCVCQCETPTVVNREPTRSLELAIAMPKPDRAKEMIERLTEMGVTRLVPVTFERTQRPPSPSQIEKLQRIVGVSCKQSNRNVLMTMAPVVTFAEFVTTQRTLMARELPGPEAGVGARFVAMPGGRDFHDAIALAGTLNAATSLQCTIGPEGGLTEEELRQCMDLGMIPIDLGKRILRIETAACVVAARLLVD